MKKIGVIIIGLIFIGIGIFMFISGQNKEKNCSAETVGTVIELKEETSTDADTGRISYVYYPIIEYKAGESLVRRQSENGSSNPSYKVNDKLNILYNPNNIEEFMIQGDKSSNLFGIGGIVLGAIAVICGIIKKF